MNSRHRNLIPLWGQPPETARRAAELVSRLQAHETLWVGRELGPWTQTTPRETASYLGQSFSAAVLDCHGGIDPNAMARAQGSILGGGSLLVRLGLDKEQALQFKEALTVEPYQSADVSNRFYERFCTLLEKHKWEEPDSLLTSSPPPIGGTPEQEQLVEDLNTRWQCPPASIAVVTAPRGRGKSSGLGLALGDWLARSGSEAALTAPVRDSVGEVFRFAGRLATRIHFASPVDLVSNPTTLPVLIVDEAAQIPVHILRLLVTAHSNHHIVIATTVGGYEGTGRGFAVRFLNWLREHHPVVEYPLNEPIRWSSNDPLEAFMDEALILDSRPRADQHPTPSPSSVKAVELDREHLIDNEKLLRSFFGLLLDAHYRTTPGDLLTMLDAPNLRLHALLENNTVLAATLIALEGQLSPELANAIYWGELRLRGQVLAENLVVHAGIREAAPLRLIRSVRIAVHPEFRRQGLGLRLIDEVHQHYAADIFGTVFGATLELVEFRKRAGYSVIRLGTSTGVRSGEPSVCMVRPVSTKAAEFLDGARESFHRDLDTTLALLSQSAPLDSELVSSLRREVRTTSEQPLNEVLDTVAAYCFGPRTYGAAAGSLRRFLSNHHSELDDAPLADREIIRRRVMNGESWTALLSAGLAPTVPAAMRALRRALRRFWESAGYPPPRG